MRKKETKPIFTEGSKKRALVVYTFEVLKHFWAENRVWMFLSEYSKYLNKFSIKNYRKN